MASIEDKIKKQSEKLAALKAKAKAVAKAAAEKEKADQLKNQIAVGEIVLAWKNSGYKMNFAELKTEIEKVFSVQSQVVAQSTDQIVNQTELDAGEVEAV